MAHRPHPKNASTNPALGPWSTCDRCGFLFNGSKLQFDYQFMGGSVPQSTGFVVCGPCSDRLNFQQALIILPPDPPSFMNVRPENYYVDETTFLTTEDGDVLTTESDVPLSPDIPDQDDVAATSLLASSIVESGGSVAVAYLDLFNGDPSGAGTSVLSAITGSATRTNIASSLTTNAGVATNTSALTVASESAATVNVSYVGIYNAASGGTLLMSGAVSASPTIAEGNVVQFAALGLSIDLN